MLAYLNLKRENTKSYINTKKNYYYYIIIFILFSDQCVRNLNIKHSKSAQCQWCRICMIRPGSAKDCCHCWLIFVVFSCVCVRVSGSRRRACSPAVSDPGLTLRAVCSTPRCLVASRAILMIISRLLEYWLIFPENPFHHTEAEIMHSQAITRKSRV